MKATLIQRHERKIPLDDDHPYRTGPWTPQLGEWDASDLDVIAGELPRDLAGVYLRNTENPLLPAIGRYHPFDGDGMLHAVTFEDGRAHYKNRFVHTSGLAAELAAGEPLWAGIVESPAKSKREGGHGARGRMKDASSTDVVVHGGRALTTFYQCGDAYQHDPRTLADLGPASWVPPGGISAHAKHDPHTNQLLYFTYGTTAPFLEAGAIDAAGQRLWHVPVPLPGPRLPHDMAFTPSWAILVDFPLYWDPAGIAKGSYRARFHPDEPTRIALVPRDGKGAPRWFEAAPTYVLHFVNAWEEDDGKTVVLDGFFQGDPLPMPQPGDGPHAMLMRLTDAHSLKTRPRRWRLDLVGGGVTETDLDDRCTEFPAIHPRFAGRPHRYTIEMTSRPGWFLFDGFVRRDGATNATQSYRFPDGVVASETRVAPRVGSTAEDDAYLVTITTDVAHDTSECQVFDAREPARGPITRLRLPERVSSGTHSCWAAPDELLIR